MTEQKHTTSMVELIKVTKVYPPSVEALNDVSLSVKQGEMVFLTGRSGAGKTTLLRLLCGLETPTRGLVEIGGNDLAKMSRAAIQQLRRSIGMAYQDFKLLPDKNVAENIAISMEVSYRSRTFIRKRTRYLLDRLDLADKIQARVGDLSRGEQQRVAIARAVANKPELILADEPTGNLDAETTKRVMELFRQCHRQGATLIIATHDLAIFQGTAHRVVELDAGCRVPPTVPAETTSVPGETESEI
ncbi:cell division ATP-binding protein FtsE [Desulfolithobacter sp.]